MTHGLAHAFQPPECANGSQHRRRIGALLASLLDPAALPAVLKQQIKQTTFGSMSQQPAPEFGEDREVKPTSGEFQTSDILPVPTCAYSISRLPIRESLGILQEGYSGQTPWSLGWLSSAGIQIAKIFIRRHRSSLISHLEIHVSLSQDGTRYTGCFFWYRWDRLWVHGHGFSPGSLNAWFLLQSLLFLLNPALAIRQHYHNGVLPNFFETLINHDECTTMQLAELRNQLTELDGKIVGLQTEMRQRFTEQGNKITGLDDKVTSLQTEMH